jgi:hypothetical protein
MNLIEVLGIVSSVIVAVSLTMKNIRWLRWVNLGGSLLFATYGFLIQAWPVFGLNAFIVVINAFYLHQLSKTKDRFSLLEVSPRDADHGTGSLLAQFLDTHGPDLAQFQPDYPRTLPPECRVFFVLREAMPINLFICRPVEGGQQILVDYAVPAWRDYHNAKYLYQKGLATVRWEGNPVFTAKAPVDAHAKYLKRLGFSPVPGTRNTWSLTLPVAGA